MLDFLANEISGYSIYEAWLVNCRFYACAAWCSNVVMPSVATLTVDMLAVAMLTVELCWYPDCCLCRLLLCGDRKVNCCYAVAKSTGMLTGHMPNVMWIVMLIIDKLMVAMSTVLLTGHIPTVMSTVLMAIIALTNHTLLCWLTLCRFLPAMIGMLITVPPCRSRYSCSGVPKWSVWVCIGERDAPSGRRLWRKRLWINNACLLTFFFTSFFVLPSLSLPSPSPLFIDFLKCSSLFGNAFSFLVRSLPLVILFSLDSPSGVVFSLFLLLSLLIFHVSLYLLFYSLYFLSHLSSPTSQTSFIMEVIPSGR